MRHTANQREPCVTISQFDRFPKATVKYIHEKRMNTYIEDIVSQRLQVCQVRAGDT